MDNIIEQIINYLKEAYEKKWPNYIIKKDLEDILNNYISDIKEDMKMEILNLIHSCDTYIELEEGIKWL